MHGQELADEIGKRKGMRPSPGTIYPALKHLKHAGFIKEKKSTKEEKTIIYELTSDGEHALKIAKQQFCKTFVGVFNTKE